MYSMAPDDDAISQLKELLARGCAIQKVQPAVFASDAEVNIVIVTLACPGGKTQVVKAYREEAQALREFVRTLIL
jgi:hypothetical protein